VFLLNSAAIKSYPTSVSVLFK